MLTEKTCPKCGGNKVLILGHVFHRQLKFHLFCEKCKNTSESYYDKDHLIQYEWKNNENNLPIKDRVNMAYYDGAVDERNLILRYLKSRSRDFECYGKDSSAKLIKNILHEIEDLRHERNPY